uniref:Integrase catalytic domain-containing protein n=1 Tax=Cacopsylla melanoneura TaxID=428564 RepID=A0A8D8TJ91_9HEMI
MATPENELKVLIAKRDAYFSIMNEAFDHAKKITKIDSAILSQFSKKIKCLDSIQSSYLDVIDKINMLQIQINPEHKPNFQMIDSFVTLHSYIKAKYEEVSDIVEKASGQASSSNNASSEVKVKLPALELPSFNGESFSDWVIFYESFKSMIHDRGDLSNAQKVQYLISKLSGRALSSCAGIPPTPENYEILFKHLVDKYNDKRSLSNSYLDTLFNFKPLRLESGNSLGMFTDKFCATVLALKALKIENLDDYVFVHLACSKLGPETVKTFEMSLKKDELPTFDKLMSFLQEQTKILNRVQPAYNSSSSTSGAKPKHSHSHIFVVNNNTSCVLCHNDHPVFKCSKFLKLSPQDRFSTIKQHALCVNCLNGSHKVFECQSKSSCQNCKIKHNTLLCFRSKEKSEGTKCGHKESKGLSVSHRSSSKECATDCPPSPSPHNSVSAVCSDSTHVPNSHSVGTTVLLSTVKVLIPDINGYYHPLRFILDSGSQSNLILESTCKKLGLSLNKDSTVSIKGIGMGSNPVHGQVKFTFTSRLDNRVKYSINALVVDKIVDMLPSQPVDMSGLNYLERLPLADDFMKPDVVSGILGAQIFPSLMLGDRVTCSTNNVVALNTMLGYVVMGQVPTLSVNETSSNTLCAFQDLPIDNLLKRFWEIETVATPDILNDDDKKCEGLYSSSVQRNDDGSYMVSLPFKSSPHELGNSFQLARNRFFSLEKKLVSNAEFRAGYDDVIKENLNEGYLVVAKDQSDHSGYFIPHFLVIRPDKASSKLRCVFDASMKSSSSKSLNDLLFSGPTLYTDLFVVLLNFRLFPIVMVADIRKMFLQIKLNPDDWKYQKILWRFHPQDQLLSYNLTTVTFGLTCSPFLALRTVKQLAQDEADNFPLAANKVKTDLYMDDLATSVLNTQEACVLFKQMVGLFKAGGFTLTKWASNSQQVLQEIPIEDRLSEIVQWDVDSSVKILGLQWSADADIFYFKINIDPKPCTKRNMLSLISRLFDPLGLLAPVILWAKQLIQQLWCLNLSWDETPPPHIVEDWDTFQSQLPMLSNLSFPRHLFVVENCTLQIFGFGDASIKGYGGVVYSRVVYPTGEIKVNLICAKSKVAPVKSQSIPRLELCAALLLSQLVQNVVSSYKLRFKIEKVLCFSDSTVVLSWIHASPHVWETFVANRVSKIQEIIDITAWWKISGTDNPADCLSRGLRPAEFCETSLWFQGPSWLYESESQWPVCPFVHEDDTIVPETESVILVQTANTSEHPLKATFLKCSSWNKLLRVVVYVLRFLKKLPRKQCIESSDLDLAELEIVKVIQNDHFSDDIHKLKNKVPCSKTLIQLSPFLDNGVIRVGGRLRNSELGYEQQHPVILPSKEQVVKLIVEHYHRFNLHTGPHLLLSILRRKFWILGGRNFVRHIVQSCNICFKLSPKSQNPFMSDLPKDRVLASCKAFLNIALDFMGPFQVSLSRRRGQKCEKAYICIFVCLATKAIHLEVASDLSTPTFLDAFKRFLARRGPCHSVLSDHGTNFVGAKNALDELYALLQSNEYKKSFGDELTSHRIAWRFSPPTGAHFNGIAEANVKAVKTHFYRCVGTQILSLSEIFTISTQIECLLNTRPLCQLSSDPSEPSVLTPAHFLTQIPLETLPASVVLDENPNRLTRHKLLDQIVQTFWKRWSLEYLHDLQLRAKWNTSSTPLAPGQVVLIKQDNVPPLHWSLARIIETYPGADGIARVALVKTQKGELKRPVNKLCPLPSQ